MGSERRVVVTYIVGVDSWSGVVPSLGGDRQAMTEVGALMRLFVHAA